MATCHSVRAEDPVIVLENSLVKIVEKTEAAVVSISRFRPNTTAIERLQHPFNQGKPKDFIPDRPKPEKDDFDEVPNDFGAGCLVSPSNSADRFVLTNYHLVRGGPIHPGTDRNVILNHQYYAAPDGTELHVHFSDKRACKALILAADPRSDLAVLDLSWDLMNPADYPVLNWETAYDPRKGQFAILFGNPYAIARDGSASVSWGIISNLSRQPITAANKQLTSLEEDANNSTLYSLGTVMQLDARLNLGTSGGPILNIKGELIGIGTSLAAIEGYEQSTGFAIPIDSLTRRIVRTLLAGQEVEYGMIGVEPVPAIGTDLPKYLPQRAAVKINRVLPGSPASRAGMAQGDIVLTVQGQTVNTVQELMRLVGLHAPDSEVEFGVFRPYRSPKNNQLETIKVKLAKWPAKDSEGIIESKPRFAPWRGISVDYSTARSQHAPQPTDTHVDHNRVLVTRVQEGSSGESAQLRPGDFITQVNGKTIKSPKEFYATTATLSGNVTLRLTDSSNNPDSKRTVTVSE